jgi:hypothetical protein
MDSMYLSYPRLVCCSFSLSYLFCVLTEIAYDAKQEEKEQHEIKMKEVSKIEELRKDKETLGKV